MLRSRRWPSCRPTSPPSTPLRPTVCCTLSNRCLQSPLQLSPPRGDSLILIHTFFGDWSEWESYYMASNLIFHNSRPRLPMPLLPKPVPAAISIHFSCLLKFKILITTSTVSVKHNFLSFTALSLVKQWISYLNALLRLQSCESWEGACAGTWIYLQVFNSVSYLERNFIIFYFRQCPQGFPSRASLLSHQLIDHPWS